MSLSYTQRAYSHFTRLPNRRINGVVLHHSATTNDLTTAQSLGGWHWWVSKTRLYRDVPEGYAAWHCGATDRWRPSWVPVGAGQGKVSDINAVSIGIEICYAPQSGEAPNAFQYDTLKLLMADLYARHGTLPVVGHGEVDLSRMPSEPTGLDWTRAAFGERTGVGRFWSPTPQPPPPPPEVPDVKLLEDWQVKGWILADLYQQAGVPFNPDAATANAWVSELREGRYRGRPRGPEHAIDGGVWAEYELGSVVWRASDGALSWDG